jgi:hypothetical protein
LAALMAWVVMRQPAKAPAVTHLKMGIQPAQQLGRSTQTWVRPTLTAMAFSPDSQTMVFQRDGTKGNTAVLQKAGSIRS